MNSKTNAERFLNAYAKIENCMYEMIRETKYVPFSQMIARAARENYIVSARQNDLRQYHELRNAIVHSRGREEEIIAEPCDSVTEDIERIAELLDKKDDVLSLSSHPVKTVRRNDTIVYAYEMMKKMKTSKIPVYDDMGYAGLITLEEIAEWSMHEHDARDTVRSILTERKNERVLFIREDASIETVMHSFESSLRHGTTLLAVLITAHGTRNERPEGIITVADLAKILSL